MTTKPMGRPLANGPMGQRKDSIAKTRPLSPMAKPGLGSAPPKTTPAPTAPKFAPKVDPRDSTYYQNTAALSQMYGQQMGNALLEQQLADNDYNTEARRMETDRARARRDLAESLLGSGGIRSGSHRRRRTEDDQDFMENFNRLIYDKGNADAQRAIDRRDIDYRLRQGSGQEYQREYREARDRYAAGQMKQAEEGEGIYKSPGIKQQLKSTNKQIARLREKLEASDSERQREMIQKKLKRLRTRRQNLVRKRNRA